MGYLLQLYRKVKHYFLILFLLFRFLQQHGGVAEDEMWNVFNMGVGYCLIVHPEFAEGVMKKLRKAGEKPFVMGKIAKGSGQVVWK